MHEAGIQQRGMSARLRPLGRRRVDPVAALKAGLLGAGIALVLFQFIGIVVYEEAPWKFLRMVAAMVRGPGALEPDDEFDAGLVAIGLALHFALALLYSLALSVALADAPRRYGALIGMAFGIALYHANLYGFTAVFPWFTPYRTIDTFVVHVAFGLLVAKAYWFFSRHR